LLFGLLIVLVVALLAQALWDNAVGAWVALGAVSLIVVGRLFGLPWLGGTWPFDKDDG